MMIFIVPNSTMIIACYMLWLEASTNIEQLQNYTALRASRILQ